MGVTATLINDDVRVIPGQELAVPLQIRNTGHVVDQFTVDVLGAAAGWAVAEPPVLNLYPGDAGEVLVRFAPPRVPDIPAGEVPFGVRVTSREDPRGSWVDEGTVHVEAFAEMVTELIPATSRGRLRGKHRLEISNQGNRAVNTEVLLADPDDQLRFTVSRPAFVAEPGTTTPVRILATPRKRFFRGPIKINKFQALVLPEGAEPISTEATFAQRALLPSWLIPVLAALLALALLLALLWFTLLKPAVKSAAKEAAAQDNASAAADVQQAKAQASRAEQKADQAVAGGGAKPATTAGAGTGAGAATVDPNDPAALTQPVDLRIQADAAPRTDSGFNNFTIPGQPDKPLDITDLLLQNPMADSGLIEIRKNGKVWLRYGLDNFRDDDVHFVVPIRFNKGDVLSLAVNCKNPGTTHCTTAVSFSGRTTKS